MIVDYINQYKFRRAINEFMNLARVGNKYLADTEPWKLFKKNDGKERTETILNISIQLIACMSILCEPFMPFTSKKISNMINFKNKTWNNAGDINMICDGHILNPPKLLFGKIEDDDIEQQVLKLKNN